MFLFFKHIEYLEQPLQFAQLQTDLQIENDHFYLDDVIDGVVFLVELIKQLEYLVLFVVEKQK